MENTVDSKAIGRRIAMARERAGFTQAEFSRAMNVTSNTACRWEQGVIVPDVSRLVQISQVARCSIDFLVTGAVWKDNTGVTPLCPYPAFQQWITTDAPKDLSQDERFGLAALRFAAAPHPIRYTIILEQLRSGRQGIDAESATVKPKKSANRKN